MRRWLALLLLLSVCGCRTASSEQRSSTEAAKMDEAAHAAMSETRTVTQGPETVTTVVEEWGVAPPAGIEPANFPLRTRLPDPVGVGGAEQKSAPQSHDGTLPQRAALIKRTTTIDQRGQVVAESHVEAQRATETHAAAEVTQRVATKRTFAPASLLALWPYLLAAALAGGLWLAIKRGVRWPPW